MAAVTGILAAPAAAQMGAFGPTGPNADHPPGLKDGWLKTFGSDEGLADFATECSALGYGLVAMGGEYRGELLDEGDATVAPASASSGSTWYPAAFVAAAEQDGSNFWSRGMVGEATGGLRGSARTNAVAFAHPDVIATPTLFAGGSYQNTVEFDTVGAGLQKTAVGTSTNDCFIASFDVDGDDINWVTTFPSVTSMANDEVHGVSASPEFIVPTGGDLIPWPGDLDITTEPATGEPPPGPDVNNSNPVSIVAVTGRFSGTIDFDDANPGSARETSSGADDAFVAILDQVTGDYLSHIVFGSSGDDCGFDVIVATDPGVGPGALPLSRQVIYVCGFFSDGAIFPGISGPVEAVGGRDLFVGRLKIGDDQGDMVLEFDRLYTYGTDGNDVARAIVVGDLEGTHEGSWARLGYTGWTRGGLSGGRDLVTGVLVDHGFSSEPEFDPAWQHELIDNDETDDAGLGVAFDALGRVMVVGQFGIERVTHSIPESASFDPAGGDEQTTWGGWDAFVARYSAGGAYLDAAYYGYNYNEWATSIVIDRSTERVFISGVFGHPGASTAYNLGFGTALPAYCRGGADMFWLSLEPDVPESLDAMVSIVIDTSGSMLPATWAQVKSSLVEVFDEPSTVRRTGGLAFNVVLFGFGFTTTAQEAVPWTVIDETTIVPFIEMIEAMSPLGDGTPVWDGIHLALDRFQASPLLPAADIENRLMLVIGDGCNNVGVYDRSDVLSIMQTLGWPAEVAGIPIGDDPTSACGPLTLTEWYEQEIVTLSQASGAMELVFPATGAADPLDPDHFEYQFRKMLKTLTCCPADFNGDGMHDMVTDQPAFYAIFDPLVGDPHPAADLNHDGVWDSSDEALFFQLLSADCPCGQ